MTKVVQLRRQERESHESREGKNLVFDRIENISKWRVLFYFVSPQNIWA